VSTKAIVLHYSDFEFLPSSADPACSRVDIVTGSIGRILSHLGILTDRAGGYSAGCHCLTSKQI